MNSVINSEKYPKGGKYRLFQAAILSLSLVLASISVSGMLLGDLSADYPDAPTWYLQMFITFPMIGNMVANIIGGAMASKIGKKNLCVLGLAMALIGGVVPFYIPTLMGKIAIRVIAALGLGLIQPLSASLIVDCFEGKTVNIMMGIQSSFVGLGASIFSYTMTFIMTKDWHYAYFAYLYDAVILVLVIIGVPAFVNEIGRNEKKPVAETKVEGAVKKALPFSAIVALIGQFVYSLGYGAMDNCLSLAAVESGTITTVQAAAVASWGGIAALLGGFVFGFVKEKIGMKIGLLALALNIIGYMMIGCSTNLMVWYIGTTIAKVGFCWWMPYINFLANTETDTSNSALATSLGFFGNSFGGFIFGYVLAGIGALLGGLTSHQGFIYGSVFIAIALVIIAIYTFTTKNEKARA